MGLTVLALSVLAQPAAPRERVWQGQAVLIDATGDHPQCTQATEAYLRDCVMMSDSFAYFLSTKPVIDTEHTCSQLGFELVMPDPIFTEFDLCEHATCGRGLALLLLPTHHGS